MCDYCSWIDKILQPRIEDIPTICTNILNEESEGSLREIPVKYEPTILVHGTADSVSSKEEITAILEKIEKAAVEVYKEMAKGCEAVEAIELAIRYLESTESNSNSEGAVNTSKGTNLLVTKDAAIMDSDFNAGCVGALIDSLHPISLAKKVMRETEHVLIVGNGARELEMSSEESKQSEKLEKILSTPPNSRSSRENATNVVESMNGSNLSKGVKVFGALARDRKGRLACGISTMDGREESIEKSSITATGTVLGCGIFSNAEFCCSVSSEDRAVYLYAPARKIVERLQKERTLEEDSNSRVHMENVLNDELTNFFEDTGESCIGATALRVEGQPEVAFTSNYFPWAYCDNGIVTSGYIKGEVLEKDIGDLDMPLDCRCG